MVLQIKTPKWGNKKLILPLNTYFVCIDSVFLQKDIEVNSFGSKEDMLKEISYQVKFLMRNI